MGGKSSHGGTGSLRLTNLKLALGEGGVAMFNDEFGMMNDESEVWGGKQCDNLPIVARCGGVVG